jgi:hypothetical protein
LATGLQRAGREEASERAARRRERVGDRVRQTVGDEE